VSGGHPAVYAPEDRRPAGPGLEGIVTDSIDGVRQLADDFHDRELAATPTSAHLIGDYRFADTYEDVSRAAEERNIADLRAFAERAAAIRIEGLDDQSAITRAMVAAEATALADMLEQRLAEISADPVFGDQVTLGIVMPMLTLPEEAVAEALVGKYRGVAAQFRDRADRHREGLAAGRAPAAFAVSGTVEQLDAWLASPLDDDPLLRTGEPPAGLDVDVWRDRLRRVIASEVRPAIQLYRDVLRDEVQPQARPDDKVGLAYLDGGDVAYARMLRYYTTTALSAEEIHEIGLRHVASLEEEYRARGPEAVGLADVPAIFEALRSDPGLHHTDGVQIVSDSKVALARAEAAMADWFSVLPLSPCAVEPTMSGPKAFYFPPPSDGSRGGTFFMNVSDPAGWGRYEVEAVSFHEGVPGHHLQLAIAAELHELPEYRKRTVVGSYAEGWGLYTERLADEMGLYSTPLDRMGMLSADSIRACRMVVDSGLHAFGWSRLRAVDYMVENSPMTRAHVAAEIDRYIVTPGQATSYMVGRLEVQRLRREAEARQGDRFDIKAYHDAVLGSGAMPLEILAAHVAMKLP
jgi:uncharacterized protein (DUF885 family)